jgi:hypothetical protein
LVAAFSAACVLALPAVAGADGGTPIKTGFYSGLVGVTSPDVEFHVRQPDKVPDLTLSCVPKDQTLLGGVPTSSITIHTTAVAINANRISFHGAAEVTPAGAPQKTGTTTLVINLHHVPGPVHHYTFEGRHLQQATAWKGTVSSPACTPLPAAGKVTLFGPE